MIMRLTAPLLLSALLFLCSQTIAAQTVEQTASAQPPTQSVEPASSSTFSDIKLDSDNSLGHFTWGLDAGSAIDLTANDMTSINITGYFGYKGSWMRFIGVGAGINTMISNSSRVYPLYAMLRTSFSRRPQLCFMDLRAGLSIDHILDYPSTTNFYGSIGLGITLAHGRKFSSHIIISYDFLPVKSFTLYREVEETSPMPGEVFDGDEAVTTTTTTLQPFRQSFPNLHYASIRIGCSF